MKDLIQKYQQKIDAIDQKIEKYKEDLDRSSISIMRQMKNMIKEVVTDLKSVS